MSGIEASNLDYIFFVLKDGKTLKFALYMRKMKERAMTRGIKNCINIEREE